MPTRDIAAVIGRHLGIPVTSIAPEAPETHFAWWAGFFAADVPALAR